MTHAFTITIIRESNGFRASVRAMGREQFRCWSANRLDAISRTWDWVLGS